jgi:hypothetical protein
MSNTASLYWLTRLDGIDYSLGLLQTIGVIAMAIWTIVFFFALNDGFDSIKWDTVRKHFFKIVIPLGIVMAIDMFTPDSDEVIFIMAGGKTLDFAAQDSSLQKIPAQTTLIISKFLENEIEQMTTEAERDSTGQ